MTVTACNGYNFTDRFLSIAELLHELRAAVLDSKVAAKEADGRLKLRLLSWIKQPAIAMIGGRPILIVSRRSVALRDITASRPKTCHYNLVSYRKYPTLSQSAETRNR